MPLRNGTSRPPPSAAAGTSPTASASRVALTVTKHTSTGASSRVVALTGTRKSPKRALRSSIPCSRRCAAVDGGAMQVTSSPPRASSAASRPPMPPGPRTATRPGVASPVSTSTSATSRMPVALPARCTASARCRATRRVRGRGQRFGCNIPTRPPEAGGRGAMRAITVVPGRSGSARLDEVPEPAERAGSVLVEAVALGICGTDLEIVGGNFGSAPPGRQRLVLGHESLGRVIDAPEGGGLDRDDLVVGIVRCPDPVPCPNCAVGEWDMCRNGRYTEHGIKELDGFGSERWRIEPEQAVKVRAGLGEVGLLAALLARQRGLEVHVLDRVTDGPKPDLVRDLGAVYHHGSVEDACRHPDVAVECTGAGQLVFDVMAGLGPNGIACLTGMSSGGRTVGADVGALTRELVLSNDVIVGSVNANRRHYQQAATALDKADRDWLARLVTRRVALDRFEDALERGPGDVKVVLDFQL